MGRSTIEGAEFLFLKGAERTIEKNLPTFLLEIDPFYLKRYNHNPQLIYDFLKEKGYFVFKDKFIKVEGMQISSNYFFIHQKKIKKYQINYERKKN